MIIFGTKGVTYSAGSGVFECPSCQGTMPYRKRRVRRFFSLYFIPIIPLDLHGEYIECRRCRGTYQVGVLDHNPGAGKAEFDAEFHRAMKLVMVDMMLADGQVDDKELRVIQDVYEKLTGRAISDADIQAEISQAEARGTTMTASLTQIAGGLNDEGKQMVVQAAFYVAAADGEFQEEERALLGTIAQALRMGEAHLNALLEKLKWLRGL